MFIHLIEGNKKYDVGISENGIQQVLDEVMIFPDMMFITVADVLNKLRCRYYNSMVCLYNERGELLRYNTRVEHARVYTMRRKPKR